MSRFRVLRGGSCNRDSWNLRSTFRNWNEPEFRRNVVGFRIVVIRRKP